MVIIRSLCIASMLCALVLPAVSQPINQDSVGAAPTRSSISGTVIGEIGPLSGAIVRVQTTEIFTTSDQNGRFELIPPSSTEPTFITAWYPGHYISGVQAQTGTTIDIHLEEHTSGDNPDYEWLPSTYHPGEGENQGCGECHSMARSNQKIELPVDQWLLDAHSQSTSNPRFITMYLGQDTAGNQSPKTRFVTNRDYGAFPLRPDPDRPYYGPGYKLDFPGSAGNCAACHAPGAAINNPYGVDPTANASTAAEGISCDFCHKVWAVNTDENGLPTNNMPGVLSMEFRRPSDPHQLFIGPLDDVAPGEDTYSPLQRQSQFCASCHYGVFWGTLIYNSYGEWLNSSFSNPVSGQTCQNCHMPSTGATQFALSDKGGLLRSPESISSHRMPGGGDEVLLQNSVTMEVEVTVRGQRVIVDVTIINDKTGHHIPTDSPLRHLILLVDVVDSHGKALSFADGPTVPYWGGDGDAKDGYYAGIPGTAYAKILEELWTEIVPSGAYWNPTRIVSDNRIPAGGRSTTRYVFLLAESNKSEELFIDATLLYRRAFIKLMDQKGWDIPDIKMEKRRVFVRTE